MCLIKRDSFFVFSLASSCARQNLSRVSSRIVSAAFQWNCVCCARDLCRCTISPVTHHTHTLRTDRPANASPKLPPTTATTQLDAYWSDLPAYVARVYTYSWGPHHQRIKTVLLRRTAHQHARDTSRERCATQNLRSKWSIIKIHIACEHFQHFNELSIVSCVVWLWLG